MVAGCGGTMVYRVYGSRVGVLCTFCVCGSRFGFGCNNTFLGVITRLSFRNRGRLLWRNVSLS